MKTGTKSLQVLAVAAAVALPSFALADGHDKSGFYIGGGGHLNNADFDFSKTFPATEDVNLSLTGVTGTYGTASTPFAARNVNVSPATSSVVLTADDGSGFGFGVHGGYRINRHLAVEGSYAILGEFTAKYSFALPARTQIPVTATDNIELDAAASLTGEYTAEATAISGAALGMYPLADNATVFGRLGYYAVSVEESITGDDISLEHVAGGDDAIVDAAGEGTVTAGKVASINKVIAEDTSGFLFGAGIEIRFGRQQNILMRAEFEVLSEAVAQEKDIKRFGITGSYSF